MATMRKFCITFFVSILSVVACFGQANWLKVFQDPNTDFATRQAAYYAENGNKKATRGSGMKQYERWRWMAQQRLLENGQNPSAIEVWQTYQNIMTLKRNKAIGDPWVPVGPIDVPSASYGAGIGRVNVVAFHPTDSLTIWAGSPSGGLWKTVNGGSTWVTNTDMLTNLGISDIVIDPNNPDIMYLASGDRDGGDTEAFGVLKTVNGGQDWNLTSLVFNVPGNTLITRLIMDTDSTQILYAATSLGIFKTTDGGANWVQKTFTSTSDLEFIPGTFDTLLCVSQNTVFKSVDAGDTWTNSDVGIPTDNVGRITLSVSTANPNYVYILMGRDDNSFRALCRSTDKGDNWTVMSETPNIMGYSIDGGEPGGQAWYDIALTVDPTDADKIWIGGINVWRSNNGGANWILAGHWTGDGGVSLIHADQHFLGFHPITNKLWVGNDGGVWTEGPQNLWFIKSNKMSISQYYRFGTSKTSAARIIAGAQDNGTHIRQSVGWTGGIGGDGMEAMVAHDNSNIVFGTIYYGELYKSEDGGSIFVDISPANNGAWVSPFCMDPQDPQTIYGGYDRVKVTHSQGGFWADASPVLTTGSDPHIRNIAVPKTDGSIVYAARNQSIYKGVDYYADWINIKNNLPLTGAVGISYIAVDPFDAQTVYVTLYGYSAANKVFKSTNGGQTWQNITGNLPNVAVFCIETEQTAERGIYIGTEYGVFFKDNTMNTWEIYGLNFPNVAVTELEITEANKKLRACTYGRGVWEIGIQNTWIENNASIPENITTDEFKIFPNPGDGFFTLETANKSFINRVLIVSSNGMVVKQVTVNAETNATSFDISELSSGIYIARVISDKGISNHRFIKK